MQNRTRFEFNTNHFKKKVFISIEMLNFEKDPRRFMINKLIRAKIWNQLFFWRKILFTSDEKVHFVLKYNFDCIILFE